MIIFIFILCAIVVCIIVIALFCKNRKKKTPTMGPIPEEEKLKYIHRTKINLNAGYLSQLEQEISAECIKKLGQFYNNMIVNWEKDALVSADLQLLPGNSGNWQNPYSYTDYVTYEYHLQDAPEYYPPPNIYFNCSITPVGREINETKFSIDMQTIVRINIYICPASVIDICLEHAPGDVRTCDIYVSDFGKAIKYLSKIH